MALARSWDSVWCYPYGACYAMCGTELAYGAPRLTVWGGQVDLWRAVLPRTACPNSALLAT
eukprot:2323755-Rhodomonas_salina.1